MTDAVRIADILERLERNEEIVRAGRESFLRSWLLQEAAIRNLEVIGEAAKRVSSPTQKRFPRVPWSGLARFRDFAIHQYERIEPARVWDIIADELPPLRRALRANPPERRRNQGR